MRPAGTALYKSEGIAGASRATLSGFCGALVGIGLSRFAYTPILPALISAEWFKPPEAAYLGAANLAGYLAGALLAPRMLDVAQAPVALRAMMLLATAAFFACAVPVSFSWFFAWRFASGLSGGALMVLAATTVLAHVPPSHRGFAGGVIFTGVGVGIVASGTLVPVLLQYGLAPVWWGLGALSLCLTMVAWGGWPADTASPTTEPRSLAHVSVAPRKRRLWALYIAYGFNAAGLVPHMVFLVDFIARGLGKGVTTGAFYWGLFGMGAIVGPLISGWLADRIGFRSALRLAFLLQAGSIGLLAFSTDTMALIASSLIIGALVPGIVPIVLGRVHELAPGDEQSRRVAWSVATTCFAVGQAGAAYAFSYVFAHTVGSYTVLFALGAGALLFALAVDLDGTVLEIRRDNESILRDSTGAALRDDVQ